MAEDEPRWESATSVRPCSQTSLITRPSLPGQPETLALLLPCDALYEMLQHLGLGILGAKRLGGSLILSLT